MKRLCFLSRGRTGELTFVRPGVGAAPGGPAYLQPVTGEAGHGALRIIPVPQWVTADNCPAHIKGSKELLPLPHVPGDPGHVAALTRARGSGDLTPTFPSGHPIALSPLKIWRCRSC